MYRFFFIICQTTSNADNFVSSSFNAMSSLNAFYVTHDSWLLETFIAFDAIIRIIEMVIYGMAIPGSIIDSIFHWLIKTQLWTATMSSFNWSSVTRMEVSRLG